MSFTLDDLLNKMVAEVYEKRPVSARQVLDLMCETLESKKMQEWYYGETVRSFQDAVTALSRRGFPLQMTSSLYFRVPQSNGGVHELFPFGSEIAVTPNNYESFDHILKQYNVMRAENLPSDVYCNNVRNYLPVSPQKNLLNSGFTPVLNLIGECVLNVRSPWYIGTEEAWQQLEVTYAIPFAGRLFPVEAGVPVSQQVPFSEATHYVEVATALYKKLNNLLTTGAPLNIIRQSPPLLLPSKPTKIEPLATAVEESTSPGGALVVHCQASSLPEQQQPQQASHLSPEDSAEFISMGLRPELCEQMTPQEVELWKYMLHLRRTPSTIMDISFQLDFGQNKIDLKENGKFIPVTPLNVDEFIFLSIAKQDEIHLCIQNQSALSSGGQPSLAPEPSSASIAPPLSANATPKEGMNQYPQDESMVWNRVQLTLQDMDSTVAREILSLRTRFMENKLTSSELAARSYRYCLPCTSGVYNLIPNGRHIKVALKNFGDFLQRVEYEKKRVGVGTSPGEEEDPPGPLQSGTSPSGTVRSYDPHQPLSSRAEPDTHWTESDVLEIWTYECTTDCLLKSDLSPEEVVRRTQLRWDSRFLRNPASRSSIPHNKSNSTTLGSSTIAPKPANHRRLSEVDDMPIRPEDCQWYLNVLHERLQRVRLTILDASKCRKDTEDALAAQELLPHEAAAQEEEDDEDGAAEIYDHQIAAMPVPPTQSELALFSPTHQTGDLLAPPQSLNM